MKTVLMGIAFAIGMFFASQAFALPTARIARGKTVTTSAPFMKIRGLLGIAHLLQVSIAWPSNRSV